LLGGLARRVHLTEQLKSEDRSLLVVDSGNLFANGWGGPNQKQSLIKASLLSRGYMRMGVAAINVGDLDLFQGLAFLRKEASKGLPLVSSNLLDPATKTHVFKPYIIKKVGAIRVAFFGLLSPDTRTDIYKEGGGKLQGKLQVKDPVKTAREMILKLHGKADVIILLSALSSDRQQEVINAAPEIHFVLGGRDSRYIQSPLWERQTPILESYKYGMYAAKLQITFANSSSPYSYERVEEQSGQQASPRDDLKVIRRSPSQTNRFHWTLIPLDMSLPEDREVSGWIKKAGIEKD
jgi:2',3'-cyclic-nucleotide 2'-phosphodiesterase (5'-nucleotidase family)